MPEAKGHPARGHLTRTEPPLHDRYEAFDPGIYEELGPKGLAMVGAGRVARIVPSQDNNRCRTGTMVHHLAVSTPGMR